MYTSDSELISVVLDNNGLIRSNSGGSKVDIEVTTGVGSVHIDIANKFEEKYMTVVACPRWFTLGENVNRPSTPEDINIAISDISTSGFAIKHSKNARKRLLGFNFAIIGPDYPTNNTKHGIITECTEAAYMYNDKTYAKHGISVNSTECMFSGSDNTSTWVQPIDDATKHAGVRVHFQQPFSEIPTVIATAFLPLADGFTEEPLARCMTEDITKHFTTVKCGLINGTANPPTYRPMAFTLLAVGNAG